MDALDDGARFSARRAAPQKGRRGKLPRRFAGCRAVGRQKGLLARGLLKTSIFTRQKGYARGNGQAGGIKLPAAGEKAPARRAAGQGCAAEFGGKRGRTGRAACCLPRFSVRPGGCRPGRQTKNRRIPRPCGWMRRNALFSLFLFDPKNGPEQAGQTLGAFYHDHLHLASLPFGKMGRPACRAKRALPPLLPHYIHRQAKRCGRLPPPGGFCRSFAALTGHSMCKTPQGCRCQAGSRPRGPQTRC